MFQPKVLKFDGGYLTYSFDNKVVSISSKFEDAFIFTTQENYNCINWNLEHYTSGYPFGFDSVEEEQKWQNPKWIDVNIKLV